MAFAARIRRVIPYLFVVLGGFALAFIVTYLFVLPESQPDAGPATPDSARVLRPAGKAPSMDEIMPEVQAPDLPPDEPPVIPVVPIAVPDLTGKDMWEAQQMLDRMKLVVIIRRDTNSFELPNTVVRQTPPPGQRMFPNDTVIITISQFPPPR